MAETLLPFEVGPATLEAGASPYVPDCKALYGMKSGIATFVE